MTINTISSTGIGTLGLDRLSQSELGITKKIINTLTTKELEPSLQTAYALGVMRHGKTIKLDNELNNSLPANHLLNQDPPKSSTVGLHASEFNKETSEIYHTVTQIAKLGYHNIRLYCPQDSKRNEQTTTLIQTYGEQLGLHVMVDDGFDHTSGFSARSKINRTLIRTLFNQLYITEKTLENILSDINGEKHILGETKYLKDYLSPEQLSNLKEGNTSLYDQSIGQCEQSYTDIITKAGSSLDHIADYIQQNNLANEYHLIVGYRTTIQAMDKKFTEIAPGNIDLNYTCNFAEMHLATLNRQGDVLKQHKELWLPNPTTYESDITQLSQLDSNINLQKTVIENQNIINAYLSGLESCIQEHLEKKRINLLTMYCKMGGVVRDLVLKNCFKLAIANPNLQGGINTLIQNQIETNNYHDDIQTIQLFNLLYTYKDFGNWWMKLFDIMNHDTRIRLDIDLNNHEIQQLIGLYAQKESYLTGSNKHLLQIKSIGGGEMINLEDIYVEQEFNSPKGLKSTTQIADQLTTHPGIYQIYGTGGEGKSTTLKAIAKYLLTTQTPPPLITWITPNTNIDELSTSDLPQVWFIDSVDELGSGGELFVQKVQSIIKSHQHISCICGSRVKSLNIPSDHIFSTLPTTEAQKDKYVSSYLNEVFGLDTGETRNDMESIISVIGISRINPLLINIISKILKDNNFSEELKQSKNPSSIYKILLKILKRNTITHMKSSLSNEYYLNPYKSDKFHNNKIIILGKIFSTYQHIYGDGNNSNNYIARILDIILGQLSTTNPSVLEGFFTQKEIAKISKNQHFKSGLLNYEQIIESMGDEICQKIIYLSDELNLLLGNLFIENKNKSIDSAFLVKKLNMKVMHQSIADFLHYERENYSNNTKREEIIELIEFIQNGKDQVGMAKKDLEGLILGRLNAIRFGGNNIIEDIKQRFIDTSSPGTNDFFTKLMEELLMKIERIDLESKTKIIKEINDCGLKNIPQINQRWNYLRRIKK